MSDLDWQVGKTSNANITHVALRRESAWGRPTHVKLAVGREEPHPSVRWERWSC